MITYRRKPAERAGLGRLVAGWRLVRGDIKRRRIQSTLLLVMIAATTATLTLSLALRGVTASPFARTRQATKGPDVSALFEPGFHGTVGTLAQFRALRHAPGVTASSGVYPVTPVWLSARGHRVRVHAEGRDRDRATVDQPLLTAGSWVGPGGVVIEHSFAAALGVHVGNPIRLGGRRFVVRGIAVTTGMPTSDPLVWVSRNSVLALTGTTQPLWYALNITLSDPARAPAFATSHNTPHAAWFLEPWQGIRSDDSQTIADEQQLLAAGSALLAVVAIAGIAVLVGGRMAEQTRRVGLLKAIGATPRLVAVVLLAENVALAIAATVVGVSVGRLLAPLLTSPGGSLLGSPGSPALTPATVGYVAAVAVAVAAAATLLPALRGARTSTINALTNPARPPQRRPGLIALSARMPVPLLLGLRLIARRPRRALLGITSVALAVGTVIAALSIGHATVLGAAVAGNVLATARHDSLAQVGKVLSGILLIVAAINVILSTWATVLDARRPSAITRALGASPRQITAGLASAQLVPALIAAVLGIPLGLGLYVAAGGESTTSTPPIGWLLAAIPATLIIVGALTAIPARIGTRQPVTEALQSD